MTPWHLGYLEARLPTHESHPEILEYKDVTSDMAESMSDADQKLFAEICYALLSSDFDRIKQSQKPLYLYSFRIRNKSEMFILVTGTKDEEKRISDGGELFELGVINVGGEGVVTVDGKEYTLRFKEALYVGRGNQKVTFKSKDVNNPAKFYLNSATAHKAYKTQLITIDGRKGSLKANSFAAGKMEDSNDRVINQLIVNNVLEEGPCQLQMGLTELKPGSVWNTMPAHTHARRIEAYFYFNVSEGNAICHLMGEPKENRMIWLHNEQAVMSPEWSIHAAAGTSNYMFIWGMAGENLDYGDMDKIQYLDMR